MSPSAGFFPHWYLHAPSFVLVALIYLLVLRGILAGVFGWQGRNILSRFVAAVTDPVLRAVGAVTPRAVPQAGVLVFSVAWVFIALSVIVYALMILRVRPLWA